MHACWWQLLSGEVKVKSANAAMTTNYSKCDIFMGSDDTAAAPHHERCMFLCLDVRLHPLGLQLHDLRTEKQKET